MCVRECSLTGHQHVSLSLSLGRGAADSKGGVPTYWTVMFQSGWFSSKRMILRPNLDIVAADGGDDPTRRTQRSSAQETARGAGGDDDGA